MSTSKPARNSLKGEISLTLSLIAVLFSLVGLGIGSVAVQNQQTAQSQASAWPYESILEIRNENDNVVVWEEGMRWQNSLGNNDVLKDPGKPLARVTWVTQSVPENLRGVYADVTIEIPNEYEIIDEFCEEPTSNVCDETSVETLTPQKAIRRNIQIAKNAKITYGWVIQHVKKLPVSPPPGKRTITPTIPTLTPSPSPMPTAEPTVEPGTFPFKLTARLENLEEGFGVVAQHREGMYLKNDCFSFKGDFINEKGEAQLQWQTQSLPEDQQNKPCIVDLDLPRGYTIETRYCHDGIGKGSCRYYNQARYADKAFVIPEKDDGVTVGWRIKRENIPTPTEDPDVCRVKDEECRVSNIGIVNVDTNSIRVEWDYPNACPGYVRGTDRFWVDVVKDGSKIVCSTSSLINSATCQIGVDDERLVDKNTEEWKNARLYEGRQYNVNIHVRDVSSSCVSQNSTIVFSAPASSENQKHIKKVLVIEYNPYLETKGGQKAFDFYNVDRSKFVPQIIDTINDISNIHEYRVAATIEEHELVPLPKSFKRADLEVWLDECFKSIDASCNKVKELGVNYAAILQKNKICEKVNNDEVDEVWYVSLPGFDLGENDMFGPRPFNINGKTFTSVECNKNVPTLGIDASRHFAEAIHSYHHRIESTMMFVYGHSRSQRYGYLSPWVEFEMYKGPDTQNGNRPPYGCGNTHFPPNGTNDYEYTSLSPVQSFCHTFRNFPDYTRSDAHNISCTTWGCDGLEYLKWNMSHMPNKEGRDEFGKLNNWWKYISDVNLALTETSIISLMYSDSNGDNKVNALDVSSIYSDLGKSSTEGFKNKYHDINLDGFVNTQDLILLYENHGQEIQFNKPAHNAFWDHDISGL